MAQPLTFSRPVPTFALFACVLLPFGVLMGSLTGSSIIGVGVTLLASVAWYKPEWVLLGLIGLSPFVRTFNSELIRWEEIAQTKQVIALLLGSLWGIRRTLSHERSQSPVWLTRFLFAWFGLMFVASLRTLNSAITLNYLLASISSIWLFWITFHVDRKWHRKILTLTFAVAGAISCLAILQYLFMMYDLFPSLGQYIIGASNQTVHQIYGIFPTDVTQRSSGTMLHSNMLGMYLTFLTPYACALLIVKSLPIRVRVIVAGLAVLFVVAIYTTNSRDSILTLAVMMVYLSCHSKHRWWIGLGMAGALLGLIYYASSAYPEMILDRLYKIARIPYGVTAAVGDTLSGRGTIWKNAQELVEQAPLLGTGPGTLPYEYSNRFGYFFPTNYPEFFEQITDIQKMGDTVWVHYHAHNIFLQLAGEIGIFGVLLYVVGLLFIFIQCERRAHSLPPHSFYRALTLATAASAIGMVVYGCFDSQESLVRGSLNIVFGAMLAIGLRA